MKETKFKQTEVGMIPCDWEVLPLNSVVDFYNGDRGVNYPKDSDFCNVGIPFINAGHLKKNQIDFSSMDYITKAHYKRLGGAKIKKDDILFCLRGSLGKYAYVNFDDAAPASSLCVLRSKKIEPKYLFQLLGSEYVKKQIVDANSGSSQPNLSARDVGNFNVVCPSTIEEQKRIAQALSDVDAVITTTEKIIAKKKALKQGTMQTLLSGKMRIQNGKWIKTNHFKQTELGPTPQEWEVCELGQLYNITSSKRVFQKDWTTAGIPFYRAREIAVMSTGKTPEEDLFITKEMFDSYTKQYGRIKENDVLITGVGTLGKVYVVKANDEFYFKDGNIIWLQWKGKNSSSLLKQFYETEIIINQIFGNSGGSTVATYTIANAKKTKLPLPPTKEEQTAIATILSDMDSEIAALETKLAKYRQLKTGMMQQLLTGIVRLVDSAETASENQSKHSVPLSFKRSVLAAEIADRLCDESTFGHVKMEKMLFLTEKMCNIDIDSSYHRDAAGPFDNRGLHSVDSQLAKQKWFKAVKQDKGYRYAPLEKRGGHKQYFERYFLDSLSVFNNIINIFKTANTEQCEIVATLYSAWEDFLKQGISPTDEQIVTEVLTNWHKSKERIPKERWLKALLWMKEHKFIPEVGEKTK